MTNVTKKILITIMAAIAMVAAVAAPAYAAVDAQIGSMAYSPVPLYVGDSSIFAFSVNNIGNETATGAIVTYQIARGAVIAASGVRTVTIAPSSSQTITFSWSPTEAGNYTATAAISIESDVNNATNAGTLNIPVYTPTNNPVVVEPSGNGTIDMTVSPSMLEMEPGKLFDYMISVQSIGERQGTYSLEIATHSQFRYWLSPEMHTFLVRPGERVDFSLFVNIPSTAEAGRYPITIKLEDMHGRLIDIESVYLTVKDVGQGTGGTGSTGTVDYDVNINIEPKTLNVEAGKYREFDVFVQNLGKKTDTYELEYRTDYEIAHWFEWEDDTVTLAAGKSTYVTLYVDVPDDAVVDTYPVTVRAEGAASDNEKASLVVTERPNQYDLSLDSPKVTPSGFYVGAVSTVEVVAPIEFTDLRGNGGRYVTVKLYVDNSYMESKTMYFATGQTKDVSFSIDVSKGPIYGEAGDYEVYYTASIDTEYEKSKKVVLSVKTLEQPSITVTPIAFSVKQNDTITMTVQVKNPTYTQQVLALHATGVPLKLSPDTITVRAGETQLLSVTGTLTNAPTGNVSAVISVKNNDVSASAAITLNVEPGEGNVGGNVTGIGLTAYLLTTAGGITAAIVALILLAVVIGYYYYSKQDEDVIEGGEESESDENNLGIIGKGPDAGSGSGAGAIATGAGAVRTAAAAASSFSAEASPSSKLFGMVKNTFIGKTSAAPEKTEANAKSMMLKSGGLNLSRIESAMSKPSYQPASANSGKYDMVWQAKDAEHVLVDLENVKREFSNTYQSAHELKQRLHSMATTLGQKTQKLESHIEPEKSREIGPKPVASNSYIRAILDAV